MGTPSEYQSTRSTTVPLFPRLSFFPPSWPSAGGSKICCSPLIWLTPFAHPGISPRPCPVQPPHQPLPAAPDPPHKPQPALAHTTVFPKGLKLGTSSSQPQLILESILRSSRPKEFSGQTQTASEPHLSGSTTDISTWKPQLASESH